jgi:transposase
MLPTAAALAVDPPPLELVSPGEGEATLAPKPRVAAAPGVHGRRYQRGVPLGQVALLPACVDDYVSADHLVHAIDAFVDSLDLAALGFIYSTGGLTAGPPAYDPADLLKLFLYGYLNRVRSSRRLEQECARNIELMWLLKGLRPSDRSIATFRSANAKALKAANRAFVRLCRELQLVGGECCGLDGSFFNAHASAASVKSKEQIEAQLAAHPSNSPRSRRGPRRAPSGSPP